MVELNEDGSLVHDPAFSGVIISAFGGDSWLAIWANNLFFVDGICYDPQKSGTFVDRDMIQLINTNLTDAKGETYTFSQDFELDEEAWLKEGIICSKI